MATFEIVRATEEHARALELRPRDAAEAQILGHEAAEAAAFCVRESSQAWTWLVDGIPACIFGVRSITMLTGDYEAWFASSPLVERHRFAFIRGCKKLMPAFAAEFPGLSGICDARYTQSLEWLRWLGFQVEPGAPFCKFWMRT